jgi:glycosyltransferase involved in cell wall biosynthesis
MSVTIAIPVYNAEEYIELAIKSVINQTYTDFELIILDDGSSDKSLEIAKGFKDERIRIISDGENLGLPARLNQVVELAKYEMIARMDADDFIPLDRLEKQVDYLVRNPDVDLVSTSFAYIYGEHIKGISIPNPSTELTIKGILANQHGICHASLLVRKSWYSRNKYDSKMLRVEDYELWLRAYLNNDLNVGYLSETGYYYRSDNTLNCSKFINTYKSGYLVITKHKDYIPNKIKFVYRCDLMLKMFLTRLIFLFNLENKLLSKLNVKDVSIEQKIAFKKLLTFLQQS